ncbi:uncharacterized protein MICPUCDRAFT_54952 [Micromonas pusilla CCMP1545]|uniref:Predicted protein n=1 Tax=Micromonas pusilla (strain CCMP1545) TaxID=564608 RepID=C1NAK5_MICPC|nr:uncharacterized protein MICPUCDRAFT_54952 [Micromonas pusilla CCMP1545]EEH50904.1 predicted protein [Micromonas pusilla CCMP1545]|eukprot:XP_003064924.1 predicted protein [Micromonas pusilla CCMP1545]
MNSLRGEGATAWHTVIPFSKAGELSTAHVRNQVRLELGLTPAAIKILVDQKLACHHAECGHATFTHNAVHHIINHKEGNAGGNRVRTHDRVVRAVAQLCKDVGLAAETKGLRGLLPSNPGRGGRHDCAKTVDISIMGLNASVNRILGDVVVPHPFTGDGRAKYNGQRADGTRSPANIQPGEYALEAEKKKLDWNGNIPEGRGLSLVPMAIDTYGFKAPRFRKFLNQLAEHGASQTVPAGDSASDAAAEATLSAIARSKSYWKRRIMGHISVALVSDLGDRIAGAPISYALRTARDSENFHAGAAAQILFMEPDTACDFRVGGLPPARPVSGTPSSRNATTCTRSGSTPLSRSVQLTSEPDTVLCSV